MKDVIIIGCGIVGASIAYELSKYSLDVLVLEKENDVACGATKANSAIVHAGYDPEPGTKMARLNVEGSKMMEALCKSLSVEYRRTGSLVLALTEIDMEAVEALYNRGLKNVVEGLSILSGEDVLKIEPNLNPEVKGALLAPSAAVVDPWGLCLALAENAVVNGAQLRLNEAVKGISRAGQVYHVETNVGSYETRYIVNASGVHSDEVSEMVASPFFKITPYKGEYYLLDKSQGAVVSHVVFQTPNKLGKGVLIAPTVNGNLIVGPTTEHISDPDDTSVSRDGLEKIANTSLRSSAHIDFRESIRNFAGVRAVSDKDDFIIEASAPNFINAAGIKSPGLTAAPAIALEICSLLRENGLEMTKKDSLKTFHRETLFKNMTPEEKEEALDRDRLYGRVICRCETITEGDILASLREPIPPSSIDGVKRRVNAGLGRCQGGFCGPRVHEILSRELGIPMEGVYQGSSGSFLLTGETKEQEAVLS